MERDCSNPHPSATRPADPEPSDTRHLCQQSRCICRPCSAHTELQGLGLPESPPDTIVVTFQVPAEVATSGSMTLPTKVHRQFHRQGAVPMEASDRKRYSERHPDCWPSKSRMFPVSVGRLPQT